MIHLYSFVPQSLSIVEKEKKNINKIILSEVLMSKMQYPEMAVWQRREKTFDTPLWMEKNHQATRREFAESGLFYLNRKDHVQCFFCATILKDWKYSDSPMLEHLNLAPTCSYILTKMGISRKSPGQPEYSDHGLVKYVYSPQVVSGLNKTQAPPNEAIISITKKTTEDAKFLPTQKEANIDEIISQVQKMGFQVDEIKKAVTRNWLNGKVKITSAQHLVEFILNNKWYDNVDKKGQTSSKTTKKRISEGTRDPPTPKNPTCEWCGKDDVQVLFLPCQCWRFCETCALNITRCVCGVTLKEKIHIPSK